jgi:predicted site-specific integrase-resolvase
MWLTMPVNIAILLQLINLMGKLMKLRAWAEQAGVCYHTAWRWFHNGTLPVPAQQLATGTIIVYPPDAIKDAGVAIYARVSGSDQKADLDRQVARLSEYAAKNKLNVVAVIKEVGSGFNGRRKGLLQTLHNADIKTILVEHRDRFMRFGFEYVEASLQAQGRSIHVVDKAETLDDVVRDMHEILVSMCARLYGKRGAKNRAQRAMEATKCS